MVAAREMAAVRWARVEAPLVWEGACLPVVVLQPVVAQRLAEVQPWGVASRPVVETAPAAAWE